MYRQCTEVTVCCMDITFAPVSINTIRSNSARLEALSSMLMKTESFGKLRRDGW